MDVTLYDMVVTFGQAIWLMLEWGCTMAAIAGVIGIVAGVPLAFRWLVGKLNELG